jgi:hypothetical protein
MLDTLKYYTENFLSRFLHSYQRYGVVWWVDEGASRSYSITYFASKKAALRSVLRKSKRYGEAYGVQSCLEIDVKERELVRFEVITPVKLDRAADLSFFIWRSLLVRAYDTLFFWNLFTDEGCIMKRTGKIKSKDKALSYSRLGWSDAEAGIPPRTGMPLRFQWAYDKGYRTHTPEYDSPDFDEWVRALWVWVVAATILVVVLRDFQG